MKKNLFILLLFFIGLAPFSRLAAQLKPPPMLNDQDYDFDKRLRFGFSLGLNFMDFQIKSTPPSIMQNSDSLFADVSHLIPGFNVNVVSDFRIVPKFHIRFLPGLAFGQRNLSFFSKENKLLTVMEMESSYIELPLSFKYSAIRKTNTRPYIIAGTNFRIDMAAYKKLNIDEGIYLRLIKGDIYYEFGFGFDFFLTYFKFSPEIKFSSGLLNVLAKDYPQEGADYARSIKNIRSQLLIISFHFE